MKKSLYIILAGFCTLSGQIEFNVDFTPYVLYYMSVIDINTGESNVPIFLADLQRSSNAPDSVLVDLEYEIIIDSDVLGINNQTLVRIVTTQPLTLTAPIHLSNMDLNLSTTQIFDETGTAVPFRLEIEEKIETGQAEQMFGVIVQTGRLPDGMYTFRVIATPEDGSAIVRENVLNIYNPSNLELLSPGGALADTTVNEVYTSFPVFQWESDLCNIPGGCEYFIRVAEFDPDEFSSIEQAIEATTRLPLDQSMGFESIGFDVLSFQYPAIGAGDLEQGNIYVWQIKKVLPTTVNDEVVLSDIFAFKVKDFSSQDTAGEPTEDTSPTGLALQTLIGDEMSNEFFGPGGAAEGFIFTGNITLNGESVDLSYIQSIISTGIAVVDSLGNETYRPVEILSVEVSQ